MFSAPKVEKPPPPPYTPRNADSSIIQAGTRASTGFTSLISTGTAGLTSRPNTIKRTLIGGS